MKLVDISNPRTGTRVCVCSGEMATLGAGYFVTVATAAGVSESFLSLLGGEWIVRPDGTLGRQIVGTLRKPPRSLRGLQKLALDAASGGVYAESVDDARERDAEHTHECVIEAGLGEE